MNKILMSTIAIAAVAAVAGVGSWAAWSTHKSSDGNYVQAGYMDLELTSEPIEISNVYPGLTGSSEITVTNNSTINGDLFVSAASFVDYENYCVEAEKNEGADPTCTLKPVSDIPTAPPFVGAGNGELSQYVTVQFKVNSVPVGSPVTLADLMLMSTPINIGSMAPGDTYTITADWSVANDLGTVDNIFMTDAVMGNFVITLSQSDDQSSL